MGSLRGLGNPADVKNAVTAIERWASIRPGVERAVRRNAAGTPPERRRRRPGKRLGKEHVSADPPPRGDVHA